MATVVVGLAVIAIIVAAVVSLKGPSNAPVAEPASPAGGPTATESDEYVDLTASISNQFGNGAGTGNQASSGGPTITLPAGFTFKATVKVPKKVSEASSSTDFAGFYWKIWLKKALPATTSGAKNASSTKPQWTLFKSEHPTSLDVLVPIEYSKGKLFAIGVYYGPKFDKKTGKFVMDNTGFGNPKIIAYSGYTQIDNLGVVGKNVNQQKYEQKYTLTLATENDSLKKEIGKIIRKALGLKKDGTVDPNAKDLTVQQIKEKIKSAIAAAAEDSSGGGIGSFFLSPF